MLKKRIYKLMCCFCNWLQKQLYDEYTYQELESRALHLENEVEELKYELEYMREGRLA